MAQDLVIVSQHERGFWQADFYFGGTQYTGHEMECMGLAPDGFRTFSKGGSREDAIERARAEWPGAQISVVEDEPGGDES
jgi:hypothetical protein